MAVTAKFKVSRITPWGGTLDEAGNINDDVTSAEVELTPDYAQGRNAEWATATPSGVIRLTIQNVDALKQFRMGQPFTVLFEQENE